MRGDSILARAKWHKDNYLVFFFFFLISNKDIYSRNYLMHKNIRQREKNDGKEREKRKKEGKERILITQERAKEQREGITRGESPSPRPVKQRATERGQ